MNGRAYDPDTARFLSADPNIQAPYDTQSYNRYSYVKNNPLKYTDPSGFFFKKLFRTVSKVWKKIKKVVIVVVVAYYTGGLALSWMGVQGATTAALYTAAAGNLTALAVAGAAGGFAAGVVATKLNGGSWSQAFKAGVKGAITGAISAGLAYGVAEVVGSHSASFFNASKEGWGVATLKATLHGITRAAMAKAQGDKTSSAFWSGFVSSGFSIGNKGFGGKLARTLIMAIVGGTTSAISGGKFANGAVTGAFIHLFNAEMGAEAQKTYFMTFGGNATVGLGGEGAAGIYWTDKGEWGYMSSGAFTIGIDASAGFVYGTLNGGPGLLDGMFLNTEGGISFIGGGIIQNNNGNIIGKYYTLSLGPLPISGHQSVGYGGHKKANYKTVFHRLLE